MSILNESVIRRYIYGVPEKISPEKKQKYAEICQSELWPLLIDVSHMFTNVGAPLYIISFRRVALAGTAFNEEAYLCNARGFPIIRTVFSKNQQGDIEFSLRTPYVELKKRGEQFSISSSKASYLVKTLQPKVADIITSFAKVESEVVPKLLTSGVVNAINSEHDYKATYLETSLNVLAVSYLLDIAAGKMTALEVPESFRPVVEFNQKEITEHLVMRNAVLKKVSEFFSAPKWHIIVPRTSDGRLLGYMIGAYTARYNDLTDTMEVEWLQGFRLYGLFDTFIDTHGADGQDLLVSLKTLMLAYERKTAAGETLNLRTNGKSRTEFGKLVPFGAALMADIGALVQQVSPHREEAEALHLSYQHIVVDRGTS